MEKITINVFLKSKKLLVLLLVFGLPVAAFGQDAPQDPGFGIENARQFDFGAIIGTRVSFPVAEQGPKMRVQLSGGYAFDSGVDVLLAFDYETEGSPFHYQQVDRVYFGGVTRRSFHVRDDVRMRSGLSLVQGVDMNGTTAFDYTSAEINLVVMSDFDVAGLLSLGLGVGAFVEATEHWTTPPEFGPTGGGIFTGIFIPVEVSFKLFSNRITIDRAFKIGYDDAAQQLAIRLAGRGPLHTF